MLYSPADRVVDPAQIETAFARVGERAAPLAYKRLLTIEDSQDPSSHVLAGDILAPRDTARVRQHLLEFLAAMPAAAIL
jgi:ferritin-like protein